MQEAKTVLYILKQKSTAYGEYRFQRVYRNYFNPSFYEDLAHSSLDSQEYIACFQSERYANYLHHDVIITITTKLLEAMYGFDGSIKPPTHQALSEVREHWPQINWLIAGTIGHADRELEIPTILARLRQRIDDGRFLELIQRMLKATLFAHGNNNQASKAVQHFQAVLRTILWQSVDQSIVSILQPKVCYVRHGSQVLIGLHSPAAQALQVKAKLGEYVREMEMQPFEEGCRAQSVSFLGYDLYAKNGKIRFQIAQKRLYQQLRPFRKQGKASSRTAWLHWSVEAIIRAYANELDQFAQRYRFADNLNSQLRTYRYYHQASLIKTIAHKMRISASQVRRNYLRAGLLVIELSKGSYVTYPKT